MLIPGRISGTSGRVHFSEMSQSPSLSYSMFQHNGRVATPKLVPRNCPRYLQATLIMGGGRLVSESMWGINISHKLLRPDQFLQKFVEILEESTLQEEISPLPPYSMLQHIGRVATPRLVPIKCPRYLQTTLVIGRGGLISEFMRGIV